MPELWLPKNARKEQKAIAVCFYVHHQTKRILVGATEEYPPPKGFLKVVCRTAREVEIMSQKMRDQDRRDEEMTEEQREAIEGPIRAAARAELVTLMLNARNNINREFCRFALQKMDEDEARRKMKRESWMHCEAAEDGH